MTATLCDVDQRDPREDLLVIPERLLKLPGIERSPLLGDVCLMAGRVDDAQRVYEDAWRAGAMGGLWGLMALVHAGAARRGASLMERVASLLEALHLTTVAPDEALSWVRVMALHQMLSAEQDGVGLAVCLMAQRELPRASFPLVRHGRAVAPEVWEGALESVWNTMGRARDDARRGYLTLKHHHMAAACPHAELVAASERLEWVSDDATGAVEYLTLRLLDRVLDQTPTGGWPPYACDPGGIVRVCFDRMERTEDARLGQVYRARWLAQAMRQGAWGEALDGWSDVVGGVRADLGDVGREALQRGCAVQGRWGEAASFALERGQRTSDARVRVGLGVLALEYLRRAGSSAQVLVDQAEALMEDAVALGLPSVRQLAFETVEGGLIELRALDRLSALWARVGATRAQREPGVPRRDVEALVVEWGRRSGAARLEGLAGSLEAPAGVRRWMMLQALLERDGRAALSRWLERLEAPTEHERLFAAALRLVSPELDDALRRQALKTLTAHLERQMGSGRVAMSVYHVAHRAWLDEGEWRQSQRLTDAACEQLPSEASASLQASFAHDLLAQGRVSDALRYARSAFGRNPLDPSVRDALRAVAEAADSNDDKVLVRDIVDDVELRRLVQADASLWGRYVEVERKLGSGWGRGRRAAVRGLEELATQTRHARIQSALMRRATEAAAEGLKDGALAARLARDTARVASGDPLALRVALGVLLDQARYADAADALEHVPALTLLPESMARGLLDGARRLVASPPPPPVPGSLLHKGGASSAQAHRVRARRLLAFGLQRVARRTAPERFREDLDALERLYLDDAMVQPWRDLLEQLLRGDVGPSVAGEIHRRLGEVYVTHLPDRDLAMEHYRHALQSATSRAQALKELERLYGEAERYDDLARILRDQVQADMDSATEAERERKVMHLKALVAVLSERLQRPEEAREVLGRLLELEPDDTDALLEAAALDRRLGRHRALVETLDRAARAVEDPVQRGALHAEMGEVYEVHLGEAGRALESYTVAFICDAGNLKAFRALEQLYSRHHQWAELKRLYDMALEAVSPWRGEAEPPHDRERLLALKGQIEADRLQRPRQAADAFVEALRLNPNQGAYMQRLEALHRQHPIPEILRQAYALRIDALPTLDPARRALMHTLAEGHLAQDAEADAIEIYKALLREWPGDLKAAERLETSYKAAERWDELVRFYQERLQAASSASGVVPIYWAIAHVAERKLRDVDLAIETYARLSEVLPGNVDVLRALGRLLEATRQWDRLIEVSEREVRLTDDPRLKAHIAFRIGSLYETAKQDEAEAIRFYEQAIALDARCAPALHGLREIYRRQERWEDVVATFQREARLWHEAKERASIFTLMADVYRLHLSRPNTAEQLLIQALTLSPNLPGAQLRLLDLYIDQARWEDAEPLVLELTRDSEQMAVDERAELFYKRARVALERAHLPEAVAALRIALDLNPHHGEALVALLDVFAGAGEVASEDPEHLEFLERLERQLIERNDVRGRVTLTAHLGKLAEGALDLDLAEKRYREAAALDPCSPSAQRPLMRLMHRLRRFPAMEQHWRSVQRRVKLDPQWASDAAGRAAIEVEVLLELSTLYMDWLGTPDKAVVCLVEARRLRPQASEVLWASAQCYVLLGRWQDALRTVQELIERMPAEDALDDAARARLCEARYYEGHILQRGMRDAQGAMVAFEAARRVWRADARPVLGMAELLWQAGNWIRLESLLRASIPAMASAVSEDAAVPLRMCLARMLERRGEPDRAEAEYRGVVNAGASPEAALDARMALARLLSERGARVRVALEELRQVAYVAPTHLAALRHLSAMLQQGDGAALHTRANVLSLLEAYGEGDGEGAMWLSAQLQRHGWWRALPRAPLTLALVEEEIACEGLDGPERAGLAEVSELLARLLPSAPPAGWMRPLDPAQLAWVFERRAQLAGALGAVGAQARVVPVELNAWGAGLRCMNAPSDAEGLPEGPCVGVPLSPGLRQQARWPQVAFALARALALHRLRLVSAWALDDEALGIFVELLVRLQEGESMPGLRRDARLRSTIRQMRQGDIAELNRAVAAMHEVRMAQSVMAPGALVARVAMLREAVASTLDRVALLACGDIGVAIDGVVAVEQGRPVVTLTGQERLSACRGMDRVRDLVRFYLSERYVRAREAWAAPQRRR